MDATAPYHLHSPGRRSSRRSASPSTDDVRSRRSNALLRRFPILCPAGNQEHIDITAENAEWFLREIIEPATGVAGAEGKTPGRVALGRNRPNPFNPSTTIRFELPGAADASLKIYDSAGRWVATLVNGRQVARTAVLGEDLPSGAYFYRLRRRLDHGR
jgi:hypothetical protein